MQIAIVLYPGMTTLDAIGPYEVLRFMPDSEIRFVGHQPGPIVTDSGVLALGVTHSYEETPAPDIVLVPGSEADTITAMADERLTQWLKQVHQTSRFTLSVCSGALILAAAGILEGHPATTHWIAQDMLQSFGAISRPNSRIVKSGKIVTSAGVSAGIDLGLFMVGEICGKERAEIIQLLIEYDPQPPFQSGHPTKASKEALEMARAEMLERAKNRRDAISVPIMIWRRTLDKMRSKFGFARSHALTKEDEMEGMDRKKVMARFHIEMAEAMALMREGNLDAAFRRLERAHVLGQRYVIPHALTHWWMLKVGLMRRSPQEVVGQALRIVLGVIGSMTGKLPAGNTGGANVSMFQKMPIPQELKDEVERAVV